MGYKYKIDNWKEWLPTMLKQAVGLLVIGIASGIIIGGLYKSLDNRLKDQYSKGWIDGWRSHTEYTNEWLIPSPSPQPKSENPYWDCPQAECMLK